MQEDTKHEILIALDGSIMIFVATPRECPVCHVMRGILINRDGQTRCWECDDRYRAGMAAGRFQNPIIGVGKPFDQWPEKAKDRLLADVQAAQLNSEC
jgi:hypothetical protein